MRLTVWSLLVLGFCGQVVQAKVPFTLEGKWLLNRNNATMAKVLELDKVIFMVAGNPPHKKESPGYSKKNNGHNR